MYQNLTLMENSFKTLNTFIQQKKEAIIILFSLQDHLWQFLK